MKEFGQRTGMLSIRIGGLNFSYENDGTPFQWLGLGDGGDSYRTAAASVGIGGFSLNTQIPQLKSFDMSKIFCNDFLSFFR
jgi:hypothetical protein